MSKLMGVMLAVLIAGASAARAADPPTLGTVAAKCGEIRVDVEPVQPASVFPSLSFEVLNPNGAPVTVTPIAIDEPPNLISGALLRLPAGTVIEKGCTSSSAKETISAV